MTKRVLIIDDDPDICESMKVILDFHKYETDIANSGHEGWEKLEENPPDIIILDVMMDTPDEGFQLSYKIKSDERFSQIPVLMATAINQATDMNFNPEMDEEFIRADAFIEKPIKPEALIAKLKELSP